MNLSSTPKKKPKRKKIQMNRNNQKNIFMNLNKKNEIKKLNKIRNYFYLEKKK